MRLNFEILRVNYSVRSDISTFTAESDIESDEEEIEDTPPASPTDVRENIKQKFLVEMPHDFYVFWDFCKSEKADSPSGNKLKG